MKFPGRRERARSGVSDEAAANVLLETTFPEEYMQGANVSSMLSQREREVILLAVDGLTTEEMARSLQVSPSTIKAHLLKIYRKLGVKKRVQLVKYVDAPP